MFVNESQDGTSQTPPLIQAYRPRLLFCPLFAWNAITGGKFISTFLVDLSPNLFTEGVIGVTLSIQYVVIALLAGWGGKLADAEEKRQNRFFWGWGRLKVMCWGVFLGTFAFVGHGLPNILKAVSGDDNILFPWKVELGWYIAMRILWAVAFVLTAPAMDGLALAHLSAVDDATQQDFGQERMYGAIWWGGASLIAGIGIDHFGFGFLYVMAVASGLLVYLATGLYLWGINRDTTGSFTKVEIDAELISGTQYAPIDEDIRTRDLFLKLCPSCYGSALILFVFLFAMGLALVDNLAFLYFNWLGSSNTIDGWTVVFTVILELPLFYLSPTLLNRFGPGKLLLVAGAAYVIRVVGYSMIPKGHLWLILILEMLHGISYACSKTGSVEYIARMTPKGQEASSQGLLFTIRFSGVVAGLGVGGWTQQIFGGRIMYLGMAALVFFGMAILLIAESCSSEKHSIHNNCSPDESEHLLVKSESACSAASAFADEQTQQWVRSLKYDSLNKYTKDW